MLQRPKMHQNACWMSFFISPTFQLQTQSQNPVAYPASGIWINIEYNVWVRWSQVAHPYIMDLMLVTCECLAFIPAAGLMFIVISIDYLEVNMWATSVNRTFPCSSRNNELVLHNGYKQCETQSRTLWLLVPLPPQRTCIISSRALSTL